MAQALVPLLAAQGCTLTCVFHDVKSWRDDIDLSDADIIMGDRLIGDAPQFTLVNWLENDAAWQPLRPAVLQAPLHAIARQASPALRSAAIHQLFQQLMRDGHLLPLFNYRYQVFALPGVEGIQLNSMGWFDFTRAWIPPPAAGGAVQPAPEPVP
jgi:ABC-type uncharacterized transport system, periplasmic component